MAELLPGSLSVVRPAASGADAGFETFIKITADGNWVTLDVQDTGIGVQPVQLPRIFERFFRGDGSRSGLGNGLGLSLARAFARAHGGDLTAVSTLGKGSVFTLRLRCPPA